VSLNRLEGEEWTVEIESSRVSLKLGVLGVFSGSWWSVHGKVIKTSSHFLVLVWWVYFCFFFSCLVSLNFYFHIYIYLTDLRKYIFFFIEHF